MAIQFYIYVDGDEGTPSRITDGYERLYCFKVWLSWLQRGTVWGVQYAVL